MPFIRFSYEALEIPFRFRPGYPEISILFFCGTDSDHADLFSLTGFKWAMTLRLFLAKTYTSGSNSTIPVYCFISRRRAGDASNPRDARQGLVKLSKTGQRLFKEASTTFDHVADSLVGKPSQNQLEKCIELYGKLL